MARFVRRLACVFFLAGAGIGVPLTAQAYSAPNASVAIVDGVIKFPDGQAATFHVRDNEIVIVRNLDSHFTYGIMPFIKAGELRLIPFEFSEREESGTSRIYLDIINNTHRLPINLPTQRGILQVKITNIAWQNNTEFLMGDSFQKDSSTPSTDALCCVTCGGITVCGGSVGMSCGSCGFQPGGGFESM